MNTPIRILLVSVLSAGLINGLSGCTTLFGEKKIDYRNSAKLPPLEVPPDLTQPASDDRYAVPSVKSEPGSATYSAYSTERSTQRSGSTVVIGKSPLLPSADRAAVERSGGSRWLTVKGTPEQVWPVVRQFWLDAGFELKSEDPQVGTMETEWKEGKPKMEESGIRAALQRALGALYSTGLRDKFRTRLERRTDGGTEVYISHRGMEEVYEDGNVKERTVWQARPSDPELEAEMLQKLLVKFGVDQESAKTALETTPSTTLRARIVTSSDNSNRLLVADTFDRAWRRVGLALDRVGFTVEDHDRSKGMYFVRYIDPRNDSAKQQQGFLSKFKFWKSDDEKGNTQAQYRIRVTGTGDESSVVVENAAGASDKTPTGDRILGLLFDQLK